MGLSLVAAVMKTRFPHTTGEDQPVPGTSVTHSTFSVFDQLTGRFGFSAIGFEPGPLKRGHCAAGSAGVRPLDSLGCPAVLVDCASMGPVRSAAPIAATVIKSLLRFRMGGS